MKQAVSRMSVKTKLETWMMKCPYCYVESGTVVSVCDRCGFPFDRDKEAQWKFLYCKSMVLQAELDDATDLVSKSKYIVFGSAALMAIDAASILSQSADSAWMTGFGITYALIAGVCVCLGWTIESHPWRNTFVGLACSIVFMGGGLWGLASVPVMIACICLALAYKKKRKRLAELHLSMNRIRQSF